MELCKYCFISLNFSINKVPEKFDLRAVSNKEDNEILKEIFKNKDKIKNGSTFLIIIDGTRYGIHIIKMEKGKIYLKQVYLHFDAKKCKLVPVYLRFVKIIQ